jgi:hypothetical protein
MSVIYRSDTSQDEFIIDKISYKSSDDNQIRNNLIIKLNIIDKLINNISLINSIIEELIKTKEYYILYEYNKKCKYPPFKIEKSIINNKIYNRFTLNQFKRFYIDNIQNIINTTNIFIEEKEDDEWTYVYNNTKIKKNKINKLLDEINQFKYQ